MIMCGLYYAWTWVLDRLQHLQHLGFPVGTIKMQRCGGDHIQPPAIGLNLSKLSSSRVRLLCWQADH